MPLAFLESIKPLYGVEVLQGYTEEEITQLKEMFGTLPQILEDYYRTAGRTDAFHHVQDTWILPENFQKWEWLRKSGCLVLLNENQGVCQAGIHREDLSLPDPPVYTTEDGVNWILSAPVLSEFLPAALAYESIFAFGYCSEEFYWLTEEEMERIEAGLIRFPFQFTNWLGEMNIILYSNAPDNMVAVLDCNGDLQMFYGAASETSYAKLRTVLGDMGETV